MPLEEYPAELISDLQMAYVIPEFDASRVDLAGTALANKVDTKDDQKVINNWRWSHLRPLIALRVTMDHRTRACDQKGFVAQRLKRFESIAIKLKDKPRLTLSTLQDIGGCRAVLPDVSKVRALIAACKGAREVSAKLVPTLERDYIDRPKSDGYRSVHLVYEYESTTHQLRAYDGMKLELQVRTELQHAWATAVEIASTYTTKTRRYSEISPDWKTFFSLASAAIAMAERSPPVPETPSDRDDLQRRLGALTATLNADTTLAGWRTATEVAKGEGRVGAAGHFLLSLDTAKRSINVRWYPKTATAEAARNSLLTETKRPNLQTVVVSAKSLSVLRRAYPNYFVHTEKFLFFLRGFLSETSLGSRIAAKLPTPSL